MLGQTPPPLHGQALMIQSLLEAPMARIERHHVRLDYSSRMDEVGRVQLHKLAALAGVLRRSLGQLLSAPVDVLYYPPAGPHAVPVIRDVVTLLALRPLARATVFHFHAGGISELYRARIEGTPWALPFRRAFFDADAAISLSRHNPPDGETLRARRVEVIPYGLRDEGSGHVRPVGSGPAREVLFVGAVTEAKGAPVLVEACAALWSKGATFTLSIVGSVTSEMAARLRALAGEHAGRLALHGVLAGPEKWERFRAADVFCFPTHYEAETFGVVCLEAMMFSLPVVATRWRGVQDAVVHGETGVLVPPSDPAALEAELGALVADSDRRARFGAAGRRRFLEHYTRERYVDQVEQLFIDLAARTAGPRAR